MVYWLCSLASSSYKPIREKIHCPLLFTEGGYIKRCVSEFVRFVFMCCKDAAPFVSQCGRSGQAGLQSCSRVHSSQTEKERGLNTHSHHSEHHTVSSAVSTEDVLKQDADLSMMVLLHCSSRTKISISSFRWCILEQNKHVTWVCFHLIFTHTQKQKQKQRHTHLETIWSLPLGVIPGCGCCGCCCGGCCCCCCPPFLDWRVKRDLSRDCGEQLRWLTWLKLTLTLKI